MTEVSKDALLALAERVEAASGSDRMLDAAIFSALHVDQDLVDQLPYADDVEDEIEGGWAEIVVPAYTATSTLALTAAALRARAARLGGDEI